MSYKQSPRAARKVSNDQGTPKSQKKVRIQDEIEVQETENYIQDLSDDETIKSGDDNLDTEDEAEVAEETIDEKSEPKGILKRSQQILENIKPNTSKFDSGSLKKKIKNPLQRIKKMADQQFKRVRTSIKRVPVAKGEIVLEDELKILKLKESPKSERREYTAYVVQHQDSEDSVEIMKLDASPSESRKCRENETHIVTPDEIIELPAAEQGDDSSRKSEPNTVESHEISISGSSSPSKTNEPPIVSKKREHQYEDIEDYISKISEDGESVDRAHPELKQQQQVGPIIDPIFDEFSREGNKNIRLSLTGQDDSAKIRQELAEKIPKIAQLEKQISTEAKKEKVKEVEKQKRVLVPMSSIEEYISQISEDGESVDRAHPEQSKVHQQQLIGAVDPIFDEFSRDFNKTIRLSLTAQDDKLRQELAKKIPKIEELEKQISDEDREEKVEVVVKQTHLLAPISSIDSTSSDEASRAHLSILAEESENDSIKKRSFEDSSFDRDLSSFERDIESLRKDDGSDVSMTLIEDDLKNLVEKKLIKPVEEKLLEAQASAEIQQAKDDKNQESVETKITETSVESKTSDGHEAELAVDSKRSEEVTAGEEPEQVVKEDVIVKPEAEASTPIKVNTRWSKMRLVLSF